MYWSFWEFITLTCSKNRVDWISRPFDDGHEGSNLRQNVLEHPAAVQHRKFFTGPTVFDAIASFEKNGADILIAFEGLVGANLFVDDQDEE